MQTVPSLVSGVYKCHGLSPFRDQYAFLIGCEVNVVCCHFAVKELEIAGQVGGYHDRDLFLLYLLGRGSLTG